MDLLFGTEMPPAVRFLLAFVIVLVLIGAVAWAVRRFASERFGAAQGRGRQPRLAVIDVSAVDSRRRLVLIRRDNVEHLLMIGGPSDIVVEANIIRALGASVREPNIGRAGTAADMLARPLPIGEGHAWPLQPQAEVPARMPGLGAQDAASSDESQRWQPPSPEPAPTPVVTPPRPVAARSEPILGEPPRVVSPIRTFAVRAQPERLQNRAPQETPTSKEATAVAADSTGEAPPKEPQVNAPAHKDTQFKDTQFNDVTHRLEESLRHPHLDIHAEDRAAPVAPTPAPASSGVRTMPPPLKTATAAPPVSQPRAPAPAPTPSPRGGAEVKPVRPADRAVPGKSLYEDLEQEMASLLGRSPGKP